MYICPKLCAKHFRYVCLKPFNQDALENLFGNIRSHGFRNVNPQCNDFKNSLKSLIINNFSSYHSVGYNCKEDYSVAVDNLTQYISNSTSVDTSSLSEPLPMTVTFPEYLLNRKSPLLQRNIRTYIAGFIIRKILKTSSDCQTCKAIFLSNPDKDNQLISVRDYAQSLIIQNSYFTLLLNQAFTILKYVLQRTCHLERISNILKNYLYLHLDLNPINCPIHNTSTFFMDYVVRFFIFNWTKTINKIIRGTDSRLFKNSNDRIKFLAYKYYIKKQKFIRSKR